jgi:hypothetical protein
MLKQCLTCGQDFDALERELTRGNGKYCSRKCSSQRPIWENRKAAISVFVCAFCNLTFERLTRDVNLSKSGLRFCSRKCKDNAQSLDGGCFAIQPEHYGDGLCSYRDRALKRYGAKCNRCGYKEQNQMLDVHHKDGDRKNGAIENLEVLCVWCHALETRLGLVVQSGERLSCTQEAVGA